jgi:hypothetical protein
MKKEERRKKKAESRKQKRETKKGRVSEDESTTNATSHLVSIHPKLTADLSALWQPPIQPTC